MCGYSDGMATYRMNNWSGYFGEIKAIFRATLDEWQEIFDEYQKGDYREMVCEMFDVWHGIMQTMAAIVFGRLLCYSWLNWIIYIICPLSPKKQSMRYLDYGCIRSKNHHGANLNHICRARF